MQIAPFGAVHLYGASSNPKQIVLFISGDGGWNQGVVDMAKSLSQLDATVVGVDVMKYLKAAQAKSGKCFYPAEDFENLSKVVQCRLKFKQYEQPILCGYSSGATLAYAIIAQAPTTTFRGAISLGFCPDLPLVKSPCKGSGLAWQPGPDGKGVVFEPDEKLQGPWIVLHGADDQVCNAKSTKAFVGRVEGAKLIELPKVGHGFGIEKNWLPQFRQAFDGIANTVHPSEAPPSPQTKIPDVDDLPLVMFPAAGNNDLMTIHFTGDGGWGVTDDGMSKELSAQGIPVAGVNSLKYFWQKRTPESTSADLARIMRSGLAKWGKKRVILIGYSFGADIMPFIVNRLPQDLRDKIALIVLIGPAHRIDFEFHVGSWFGLSNPNALEVLPELKKLAGMHILCFYGKDDDDTVAPDIKDFAKVVVLDTGHRVGKNFGEIVKDILVECR